MQTNIKRSIEVTIKLTEKEAKMISNALQAYFKSDTEPTTVREFEELVADIDNVDYYRG